MIVTLTIASRGAHLAGVRLPVVLGVVIGVGVQLALGGWFFGSRGRTAQGVPMGWSGGVALTAITLVLLALTVATLRGALYVFGFRPPA